MKIKKLLCAVLAAMAAVPTVSAFAMSTAEFDNGMRNGINYFNGDYDKVKVLRNNVKH